MNIIDNTPTPPPGPVFNKDAVYESELRPLVDKITTICNREGMPFIVTVCLARDPDGRITQCSTIQPGAENFCPSKFAAVAMVLNAEGMSMVPIAMISGQKPEGGLPA